MKGTPVKFENLDWMLNPDDLADIAAMDPTLGKFFVCGWLGYVDV